MIHSGRAAVIGLSVGLLSVIGARAQDIPVFRSTADAVTVGVSVRRGNRPVTDLEIGDFEVLDNEVKQAVSALSYEKQPIDLTVLLDVSRSVSGAVLAQLQRAVSDLSKDLAPDDRLRLVTFNMRVRRILDLDEPREGSHTAFDGLVPGGSSAVLDALAVALASPGAADRRQFIVLFSDGKDSSSITTPDQLVAVARRTSPTISVVLARPFEQGKDRFYSELTSQTGGTVVSLLPRDNLGDGLERVLESFRSSYVLTYSPRGVPAGGAHTIAVRVKREGVTVRARRGYVVP